MPAPKYRSRTFRRIKVRTPGGRNVIHYKRRRPAKAQCAECGRVLPGTLQARVCKVRNTAKTKKRPQRPYGGQLCTRCMRAKIRERIA